MNGCLSQDQFIEGVVKFLSVSDELKDGWKLQYACPGSIPYLTKQFTLPLYSGLQTESGTVIPDQEREKEIEDSDPATLVVIPEIIYQIRHLYVTYSSAYSVPCLYFTAALPNGSSLTLDEIWSELNTESITGFSSESKWTTLTQQEHPYLGFPCFHVHPCHTAQLMAKTLSIPCDCSGRNYHWYRYLVSWLSIVSPFTGFALPCHYALPHQV